MGLPGSPGIDFNLVGIFSCWLAWIFIASGLPVTYFFYFYSFIDNFSPYNCYSLSVDKFIILVRLFSHFGAQEFPSVQFRHSVMSDSLWSLDWTAACQTSLSITNSWSLLKLMSIKSGSAIQPSHSLVSPSPAFNLSQHWGLFKWVSSLHQVAKILEFQHQSFQWIFRTDFL